MYKLNYNIYYKGKELNKKETNSEFLNQKNIILILHGLFGRAKNWHSTSLDLSKLKDYILIVIDLRNHGENEKIEIISYELMVNDVYNLSKSLKIKKMTIIGHSMGGKVGMLFSINHPAMIRQLFVIDIAPVEYKSEKNEIIDHLLSINVKQLKNRNEADLELSKYITDKTLRLFLLQNLKLYNNRYEWSLNLRAIKSAMPELRSFPKDNINYSDVDTICIYGENSQYVDNLFKEIFKKKFYNLRFKKIKNAGHWLHAEKPKEFIRIISKFLI